MPPGKRGERKNPMEKKDKVTAKDFKLNNHLTLKIYEGKEYDSGYLGYYDMSVHITIRQGKNGAFISFPSYKMKNGDYKEYVTLFSKEDWKALKDFLEENYK